MNPVSIFTEDILMTKSLETAVSQVVGLNATLIKSSITDGLACSQNLAMITDNFLTNAWCIKFAGCKNDVSELLYDSIKRKLNENGYVPDCLIVQNVGLFMLGCNDQVVKKIPPVFRKLRGLLSLNQLPDNLPCSACPRALDVELEIKAVFGLEARCLASVGIFSYAHSVKTLRHDALIGCTPFSSPLTVENVRHYVDLKGYFPRIVVVEDRVYGLGFTEEEAIFRLALSVESSLASHWAALFSRIDPLKSESFVASSAA